MNIDRWGTAQGVERKYWESRTRWINEDVKYKEYWEEMLRKG